MSLTIGSLFSGYGGLDLAVESVTGAEPAWFVEFDAAPSKILAHHWPNVPNYGDVTKVRWEDVPQVDILTGGYPCQPFSAAGHRKGTTDERHLWPHVREAIRVLRPRLALFENVAGHRSLGFDQVLADLAADGLDAWWTSLRASDVGAPHHRERLFILACPADAAGASEGSTVCEGGLPLEPRRMGGALDGRVARLDIIEQWGAYAPAVRRWERVVGPAPTPTELNRNGQPRLNPEFAEWMMGLPAGWVTDVPGLSRTDQLKAIGNGVCPQQAEAAIAQLLPQVERIEVSA